MKNLTNYFIILLTLAVFAGSVTLSAGIWDRFLECKHDCYDTANEVYGYDHEARAAFYDRCVTRCLEVYGPDGDPRP